jgi:hypothetical protein
MYKTKKKPGDYEGKFLLVAHLGDTQWIVKCPVCGREYEARTGILAKQLSCRQCQPRFKGAEHHSWRGCGQISHDLYTTYKHGALARNLDFTAPIEHLWEVFEQQEGKCCFTGEPLTFNETYHTKTNRTASLDRIDSKKGYEVGNLQWVHRDVNKLKKNFSNVRFLEICRKIATYCRK